MTTTNGSSDPLVDIDRQLDDVLATLGLVQHNAALAAALGARAWNLLAERAIVGLQAEQPTAGRHAERAAGRIDDGYTVELDRLRAAAGHTTRP
jgi:UDP-N-acetylmuramyl pentapeptide synthase